MTQPQRIRDFIGPYQIGNRLGGGAFSSVYEARDPESGRSVAVKLLEHASALPLSAFRAECQSVQELHHPNIVRLETLLEHDGWTAIVMELVPGTDLLNYVRPSENDGTFDEARVRSCFAQLASALAALHAVGVVHRDIKPQNVRVTPEGRVVLFDFGLIKYTSVRDEALDDWYQKRHERSEMFERPVPEEEDDLGSSDEPDSLLPPRGQSSVSQVLSQMMVGKNEIDTNMKQPKARKRRFNVDVRHHQKLLYSGPLNESVTILGTDREADIQLKGRYVAGRHSLLVRVRDSLLLVRLGSSSAARVNGLPKLQAFLKTGDVIQIDETTITVTEE